MGGLAMMIGELGPSQNCLDFTSPANDCGIRFFIDAELACVDPLTDLPAPCRCDAQKTSQNSFATLDALFHNCP